jgi:hypothetical protein
MGIRFRVVSFRQKEVGGRCAMATSPVYPRPITELPPRPGLHEHISTSFDERPWTLWTPIEEHMGEYLSKSWNNFPVFYTHDLDGGGSVHADDFIELLTHHVKPNRFARAFEWCSGPGFVGYATLAHGICESLCLADFFGPAVTAARYTAKANGVEARVSIYQGDNLSALPSHESFDLVLGNPPHFPIRNMTEFSCNNDPRIYVDEGWRVHRQFFSTIRKHLTRDGLIVLSENTWGSHLETFREMIESSGLVIAGWRWSNNHGQSLWYMFVTRDDSLVRYEFGA